mgnify:CR=1 FL=1
MGITEQLGPSNEPEGIPRVKIHELLSNERRQYVVEYVSTKDGASEFGNLVDYVAARENGIPVEQLDSDQRKCVYTALRQSHLPKLADAAVVEFEKRRGMVEPGTNADVAQEFLTFTPGRERTYSYSYLGLSVGGFAFTGLHGIGVPLFDAVPTIIIVAVVCFLFGFLATLHAYSVSAASVARPTTSAS